MSPDEVADVYRAYLFGAEAHQGQKRESGEAYIFHPLAVARILAELRMDPPTIIAAILHDVIEDTPTAKEHLAKSFGEEVAELVDGVSKLTHIEFETKAEAQAENFRKMMLAMVNDIRVILVKLADRLHNMRTLGVMRPEKCRRIARETLEIYAPIANRLGMHGIRMELEDLGFLASSPMRYRVLTDAMKKVRGNRREIVGKMEETIHERLKQEGLPGRVIGREKHLYSIYRKMREKRLPFNEVMDVFAFRIVVDSVDSCYRVLGAVHNLYTPVPDRFKDYIAIPKVNGYQSLHTVLFSPYSVPIEVQIRTEDMDKVAEAGIAAHWQYKTKESDNNTAQQRARQWLSGLLDIQQYAGNSIEFLENVKIDLFPDEVYVFTPNGEIREMPRGTTAVDFAYAVHTDVGNHCVAVKIDRRLMPLRTELLNGQTVEIITANGTRPNPAWLDFVVTAKARSTIRHYLKNLQRDESVSLGQRLLEKSLRAYDVDMKKITRQQFASQLKDYGLGSISDLLSDIGLGNRIPALVARSLLQANGNKAEIVEQEATGQHPLVIKGTEGAVVSLAKCCRPIPGDSVLGFVTAGRGIVIHSETCKNVAEYRKLPEKWIDVQWDDNVEGEFPVELRLLVNNQRGVLATVAAAISELGANIEHVHMEEKDGLHSSLSFIVAVAGRKHLARVMMRLRNIELVERISRMHH